jgi:hypothetical protein
MDEPPMNLADTAFHVVSYEFKRQFTVQRIRLSRLLDFRSS